MSTSTEDTTEAAEESDPQDEEPSPAALRRSARIRSIVITSLVGLCTLAVGFGVGVWLTLPTHPDTNSAEAGFARDMSIHHAQAVSMAMLEYRSGEDEHLRSIAYDVATSQQAQIGMMQAWLDEWGVPATGDDAPMEWTGEEDALIIDGLMPGMATADEIQKMRELSGRELDILFCQLMIEHHVGGIHMVDEILERSENDTVRDSAESMKKAQQYEIDILQRKLQDFGVTQ